MHMAQLMPLPLTVSCFSKIQIDFTSLVPAHPGSPGKRAVKRLRVCVFVCVVHMFLVFVYYASRVIAESVKASHWSRWAYTQSDLPRAAPTRPAHARLCPGHRLPTFFCHMCLFRYVSECPFPRLYDSKLKTCLLDKMGRAQTFLYGTA